MSFSVAFQIIKMADQFWPLKIAVMNYINQCYLDCGDKKFLAKPTEEENEGDEAPKKEHDEETDIEVLLNLVENLN